MARKESSRFVTKIPQPSGRIELVPVDGPEAMRMGLPVWQRVKSAGGNTIQPVLTGKPKAQGLTRNQEVDGIDPAIFVDALREYSDAYSALEAGLEYALEGSDDEGLLEMLLTSLDLRDILRRLADGSAAGFVGMLTDWTYDLNSSLLEFIELVQRGLERASKAEATAATAVAQAEESRRQLDEALRTGTADDELLELAAAGESMYLRFAVDIRNFLDVHDEVMEIKRLAQERIEEIADMVRAVSDNFNAPTVTNAVDALQGGEQGGLFVQAFEILHSGDADSKELQAVLDAMTKQVEILTQFDDAVAAQWQQLFGEDDVLQRLELSERRERAAETYAVTYEAVRRGFKECAGSVWPSQVPATQGEVTEEMEERAYQLILDTRNKYDFVQDDLGRLTTGWADLVKARPTFRPTTQQVIVRARKMIRDMKSLLATLDASPKEAHEITKTQAPAKKTEKKTEQQELETPTSLAAPASVRVRVTDISKQIPVDKPVASPEKPREKPEVAAKEKTKKAPKKKAPSMSIEERIAHLQVLVEAHTPGRMFTENDLRSPSSETLETLFGLCMGVAAVTVGNTHPGYGTRIRSMLQTLQLVKILPDTLPRGLQRRIVELLGAFTVVIDQRPAKGGGMASWMESPPEGAFPVKDTLWLQYPPTDRALRTFKKSGSRKGYYRKPTAQGVTFGEKFLREHAIVSPDVLRFAHMLKTARYKIRRQDEPAKQKKTSKAPVARTATPLPEEVPRKRAIEQSNPPLATSEEVVVAPSQTEPSPVERTTRPEQEVTPPLQGLSSPAEPVSKLQVKKQPPKQEQSPKGNVRKRGRSTARSRTRRSWD